MEEKIYQKLIAGLKNNSLSERTIRAMAKKAALKVTEESQITDEFVSDYVDVLQEMNGQLSKDVAEIVKKQVEKTPAPQVEPPQPPKTDDNPIAEMLKKISDMEVQFKESQKQQRIANLKAEAENKAKLKQATNQYILKNAIAKVEISDDDTADTLAEKVIPIYDIEYKAAFGDGSIPRGGDINPSPEQANARLTAFKEKMEKKK